MIYSRWAVSAAMLLHLKLLAQMVGHFYEAKQREHAQRQNAYTHAIYETGARLTHDVKNLLQSLKSLCSAAASSSPDQALALQSLVQRQLPQITQRLNITLEKLRSPLDAGSRPIETSAWWSNLMQRYEHAKVEFAVDGRVGELTLPAELFDSVADNLIENACNKAAQSEDFRVRVTFSAVHGGTLTVTDNGLPVPRNIVYQLFAGPVQSETGLGVGLYQSSRLANDLGYVLSLASNEPGEVSFVLRARDDKERSHDRKVA
jgi:signal transduction histidine kinase